MSFFWGFLFLLSLLGVAIFLSASIYSKFKHDFALPIGLTYIFYFYIFVLIYIFQIHLSYFQPFFVFVAFCSWSLIFVQRRNLNFTPVIDFLKIFLPVFALSWFIPTYSEIPSDVYGHLEKVQRNIAENGIFSKPYIFHSFYSYMAGLNSENVLPIYPWVFHGNIALLLTIYFRVVWRITSNWYISLLSILFAVSWWGHASMSYLTYYTVAPTYFNFIHFAIALLAIEEFRHSKKRIVLIYPLLCIPVFALSHMQEFFFLGAYAGLIGLWYLFRRPGLAWLCLISSSIVFCITSATRGFKFRDTFNGIITIFEAKYLRVRIFDFVNPTSSLRSTLTYFGILVIFIFLITIFISTQFRKRWSRIGFFIIAPLGFYLVPGFSDLLMAASYNATAYRLIYLVHYWILAAIIIVEFWDSGNRRSLLPAYRAAGILTSTCLVLALAYSSPVYPIWGRLKSVFYKVEDVHSWQSYYQLLDKLNEFKRRNILTDGMTGYPINAGTPHLLVANSRFFNNEIVGDYPYECKALLAWLKYRHSDLIVINLRENSSISLLGKWAGHWSEQPQMIKQNYSSHFLTITSQILGAQRTKVGNDIEIIDLERAEELSCAPEK